MVDLDTPYTSILGAELLRVYTKSPSDIFAIRERYHHFEADIPYSTRFMIDVGLTGGIQTPDSNVVDYHEVSPIVIDAPARVSIIDIECEDHRGFPESTAGRNYLYHLL